MASVCARWHEEKEQVMILSPSANGHCNVRGLDRNHWEWVFDLILTCLPKTGGWLEDSRHGPVKRELAIEREANHPASAHCGMGGCPGNGRPIKSIER